MLDVFAIPAPPVTRSKFYRERVAAQQTDLPHEQTSLSPQGTRPEATRDNRVLRELRDQAARCLGPILHVIYAGTTKAHLWQTQCVVLECRTADAGKHWRMNVTWLQIEKPSL